MMQYDEDQEHDRQVSHAPPAWTRAVSLVVYMFCALLVLTVAIGVVEHFHTLEHYAWWVVLAVCGVGALLVIGLAGHWLSLRIRHGEADLQARRRAEQRTQEWHEAEMEKQRTQLHADERGNYPVYKPQDAPPLVFPPGNPAFPVREGRRAVKEVIADERRLLGAGGDSAERPLPTFVRYEEVEPFIPRGETLIGVSGKGVESKPDEETRALIWVVGSSGTGKSNTVARCIDDDYRRGACFLVIDPHFFKPDSLSNAIGGYASRFLAPIAHEGDAILHVLHLFLAEFTRRKNGGERRRYVRIILDEVTSLVSGVDPKNEVEVKIAQLVKEVARVCGQEARGFNMGGIFISQDAAGLSWLRKRALLVLAHQLTMMSERRLACNEWDEIARDMDTWPKGRTLAYGIAFGSGGRMVVQQPLFTPRRVVEADPLPPMPPFPLKAEQPAFHPSAPARNGGMPAISGREMLPGAEAETSTPGPFPISDTPPPSSAKKELAGVSEEMKQVIRRLYELDVPFHKIARAVGLDGGQYHLFRAVCLEMGIDTSKKREVE